MSWPPGGASLAGRRWQQHTPTSSGTAAQTVIVRPDIAIANTDLTETGWTVQPPIKTGDEGIRTPDLRIANAPLS
ncbi:MAG: hypothetical protein ACE5K7_02845, partial [Phycisphaerae bacterium]